MEDTLSSFRFSEITNSLPDSFLAIFVTLALSFLIGLEREEHAGGKSYSFGGVRTFPIIGLCGYLMARLTSGEPLMLGMGIFILGSLLWLSYRKKLELSSSAGMTSEVSGLFTFLLGAFLFQGNLWEATTLAVITLLLLELKTTLESLARKIPPEEIFTFTRFLLISAVILPVVPDRDFFAIHLNPFRTWLIVVAISSLSYIAYVIARLSGPHQGVLISAILGGIYSSTSTTVLLAKQSRRETADHLYTGAIVLASGFMYLRLALLLSIFNRELGQHLLLPFLSLGFLFGAVGLAWIFRHDNWHGLAPKESLQRQNPLELQTAMLFAAFFTLLGALTLLAQRAFGVSGIYGLSVLTGLADIDPFVMSLTQNSGVAFPAHVAAVAIIIATASNNVIKGVYAAVWGKAGVRKNATFSLLALSAVSLLALAFVES